VHDGLSHFIIPLTLDKTILKFEEQQVEKERALNFYWIPLRNGQYLSIFNKKLGTVSFDSRHLLTEMS